MALGTCGNSIKGLNIGPRRAVLPRVDDCVSLMMGSLAVRREFADIYRAFYLTRGWMDGEANLVADYARTVEKYGEELGCEIFGAMLDHYENLAFVDTGTYDIEALARETDEFCTMFDMGQVVAPGDLSLLVDLLTGPWTSEKFIVKLEGETFTESDMLL